MPKISIITTAYKHEKFILETIESIINQSYTDWELIIWDDSPDNNTWNIIQKYIKKYPNKNIKAFHHSPNKWIVDNMNFLISKADKNSNYITFLEWDDLFTYDNLEKKVKIFEKFPEVALVYNNLDITDENSNTIEKNYLKRAPLYLKNEKITKSYFLKNNIYYLSYSSLMIKKNILLKEKIINVPNNKLYSVSDWDLFFRISTKYRCYWTNETLTLYRRHKNNFSFSENWNIKRDLDILVNYYYNNNIINKNELNLFKWKRYLWDCNNYLEKWEKRIALSYYLKSIYLFPSYNIKSKLYSLIRFIIPHKLQLALLKKYFYNKK